MYTQNRLISIQEMLIVFARFEFVGINVRIFGFFLLFSGEKDLIENTCFVNLSLGYFV